MWQNSHSQFLYPYKEVGNPPPYDPNIVITSPEVEKWMNEQFAKTGEKRTVEMKTDVLGRVKSSSDKAGQGLKAVKSKEKRLVKISDMHIQENNMEPMYASYEYNTETKKYNYSLNGKKMGEKEYFDFIEKRNEKFKQQKTGKRNLLVPGTIGSDDRTWVAWMTAEEISELTKKYKELVVRDYTEPISEASQDFILSTLKLSTHAFPNYKGQGIGVHVNEANCSDISLIADKSRYTLLDSCIFPDTHHAMVVNTVQMSAPLAYVFGSSSKPYFLQYLKDPFSFSPPIEISTHSYYQQEYGKYSADDADMDNYIYEKRIISFKSAGNYGNGSSTYFVSSPGKALNIITVGAIDPLTNNYWYKSDWKNDPDIANEKPEIAMYHGIDLGGSLGTFNGTSAAAPLAAGFTASLLSQHSFFKRHPALVKAALLAGETISIPNAGSHDTDNRAAAKGIVTYPGIASVATAARNKVWERDDMSDFVNGKIEFTENNIQANKRYRIAIAWLSRGSYLYSTKWPPHDFDLWVKQNGSVIAQSRYSRNPFEIVDFVTTSNAPLTIIIEKFASYDKSSKLSLGYYMREDF